MEIVVDGLAGEKYTALRLSGTFVAPFAGEMICGACEIQVAHAAPSELLFPAHEEKRTGIPTEIKVRGSPFHIASKFVCNPPDPGRSLRGAAASHAKVAHMCVDGGSSLFGRAEFLGALAVAAAPLFAGDIAAAAPLQSAQPSLTVPKGLSRGNAAAAHIAASSPFIAKTHAATVALARSIGDGALRENVLALLADPKPLYAQNYPAAESRFALRDELVRAGFLAAGAPVEAIFPAGTEAGAKHAPQPFWCAGGSGENSHHSYPGGLLVHEFFNASIGVSFSSIYDRMYFNDRHAVDRDTVIGAALYHDIMKTVVFQWNDDGTLFKEYPIADTGGHHVLSGAEAIVRGRSPRFVIALLSAHASPSLGDEARVATWCRAAALIAGVDPVEYGLLKKSGDNSVLAPNYVPLEAFVNFLSDHDYVISVHAVHEVAPQLQRLARNYTIQYPSPAWFKNDVLSNLSAIGLYQTLANRGQTAFDRNIHDFVSGKPPHI